MVLMLLWGRISIVLALLPFSAGFRESLWPGNHCFCSSAKYYDSSEWTEKNIRFDLGVFGQAYIALMHYLYFNSGGPRVNQID